MNRTSSRSIENRTEALDTIAAVLPIERRDELAELLTDQDVDAASPGQRGHGRSPRRKTLSPGRRLKRSS